MCAGPSLSVSMELCCVVLCCAVLCPRPCSAPEILSTTLESELPLG